MVRTQCTHCEGSLRIEIIEPFPNLKYKISERNHTSHYGGIFCCSHCGKRYIEKVENLLIEFKCKIKEVKKIQRWWKILTR